MPGIRALSVGDRITFDVYRNGKVAVAIDVRWAVKVQGIRSG